MAVSISPPLNEVDTLQKNIISIQVQCLVYLGDHIFEKAFASVMLNLNNSNMKLHVTHMR